MQITGKRYLDYTSFIRSTFGERVQKISINAGFTCPNRDGTKGYGGCTYCNNDSFHPDYCQPDVPVDSQIQKGIHFFNQKYGIQKYLAYFQSYTNTYADIDSLKKLYSKALEHPEIIGLVIGTRPDCISDAILDYLEKLAENYFITLEIGIESTLDKTLQTVNRAHTYQDTIAAFERAKNRGIHLGGHLILGLPGENKDQLLNHARNVSQLPLDSLKLHQLQIVKNSVMAVQYRSNPDHFNLFSVEEYVDLITEFIGLLRPDIIIGRFAGESAKELLVAPHWNLKNFEIVAKIDKALEENNSWQGKYYVSR